MVEDVPAEPGPSGRLVVAMAAVAVLVLVAAGYLLFHRGLNDSDVTAPASTGVSGTPSTTRDEQSPPGTSRPSMTSRVSIGSGHVVTESQHVDFGAPVSRLTLSVPAGVPAASGRTFHQRIGNLQILTGGAAPIAVTTTLRPGSAVDVPLPADTQQVDMVFTAYRAVVAVSPAAPEEALALATPLTIASVPRMRTTLRIDDVRVTHVGCVTAEGPESPCGSMTGGGWTVRLAGDRAHDMVVAQLTLPG